jgi:hypothetical protein
MGGKVVRRISIVLAAACVLLLCSGAPAGAAYDPVAGGVTKLKLDRGFLSVLSRNGVKISARSSATFKKGTLAFPVASGKFDPTSGEGTVEHDGSVLLKGRAGAVPFKDLQLKTTRRSAPIAIKLGGGQLKLGTAKRLRVARAGFGGKITVSRLVLSGKVAVRLSKRLRLKGAFTEGMPVGTAVTTVLPESVSLLGRGSASLDLDPAFAAKLNELHVAVNPIFPAEHPGSFTLPIFGGKLAPDLSSGRLETQGALELLQLGGGQAIWSDTTIDLGAHSFEPSVELKPSPPYGGKLGPLTVASLEVAAGSAAADPRKRTLRLSGGRLLLGAPTAASLNELFAKPQGRGDVFAAGEALGAVSFEGVSQ